MNKPQKAYSAYQLISVATVANTLALSRSIAGLEALQQLAEAVTSGSLCADLYPPHAPCFNGGNSDLIGKPSSNSPGIWLNLATKSAERYKGDVDDFSYPPAASTWHLLADDVFAFANSTALTVRAAAAMRELAIRYKAELGDLQGDAAMATAPDTQNAPVGGVGALGGMETAKAGPGDEKPWLVVAPKDPIAEQPWYTPARYFARQLVIEKPTLLANRGLLADKVSTALFNAGFKKRGGKVKFDSSTVLKAFTNVTLG